MKRPLTRAFVGAVVLATGLTLAVTGAPPVGAEVSGPTTFSYIGPAVPIADAAPGDIPGPPTDVPLTVTGMVGAVTDIDLRIDGGPCSPDEGDAANGIDHTAVGDLDISLIAPDGTTINLVDNVDDTGNNFCQTVLDDEAATTIDSVVSAGNPFIGSFTPSNPLSGFDGSTANGVWTVRVQDTLEIDSGNIRAFSLIVSSESTNAIAAVKTVAGSFVESGAITYTVALTNNGNSASTDNPGNEFVDVLPASVTLISAAADTGTAVADVGTNTVTWNGVVGAGGTVTITINATIDAGTLGTVISNQGTVNFDPDVDGTNDSSVLTDSVAGGTLEPTTLTVAATAQVPTTTTTAPSTPGANAVSGSTLPQVGGPPTAGPTRVSVGLVLTGTGCVLLAGTLGRRRVTTSG